MTERLAQQLAEQTARRFYGKYRGIVVDNADPEQLGRLCVLVPSVLGRDCPTTWALPCAPYGGSPEQGVFFVPDIDANVWVEFEEGNLDAPIWTGVFWAKPEGESAVPTEARNMQENAPQRRVVKTTSGHVLEFCDVEGEESITVLHKDGARVELSADGSVTIANNDKSYIYLNAADSELSVAQKNGNSVLLSEKGMTFTNNDGTSVNLAGEAVQVLAKNVHVRSETVSLGEGAMEPAILGRTFAAIFDAHTHPTALGPSGPPIPVPMPLSAPTNPAISKAVMVK